MAPTTNEGEDEFELDELAVLREMVSVEDFSLLSEAGKLENLHTRKLNYYGISSRSRSRNVTKIIKIIQLWQRTGVPLLASTYLQGSSEGKRVLQKFNLRATVTSTDAESEPPPEPMDEGKKFKRSIEQLHNVQKISKLAFQSHTRSPTLFHVYFIFFVIKHLQARVLTKLISTSMNGMKHHQEKKT